MLETELKKLTSAVEALTAQMQTLTDLCMKPQVAVTPQKKDAEVTPDKSAPVKDSKPAPKKSKKKDPEAVVPTVEDLRALALQIVRKNRDFKAIIKDEVKKLTGKAIINELDDDQAFKLEEILLELDKEADND